MFKNRLEAFSDGVLAIVITIMVLELRTPQEASWAALAQSLPTFLSYLLSFVYVGIYWNNHHHMMQLAERVNGAVLWANLHLLFWISLFPFSTRWMDETGFVQVPVIVYGINLLCAAIAYFILVRALIRLQGARGALHLAVGRDWKGTLSPAVYLIGLVLAWLGLPAVALGLYTVVALLWLVPDRRMERYVADHAERSAPGATAE
ncbi:TMEM175 family protein [Leifsonia sp. Root112D2]|jgi:uncharacterized membrane protein|uniref:TMEM175 family protein n=1 Tax=Leifsonia sp. Root112D2 TaxID=1736426 RepID=UPI0006F1FCA0|nr:TMEM175 family protein [Leifsonia sp. Root112D2]KQV06771.1 hypothetical protein ASC63_05140 [Leifsonia sp. Root112D2]